MMCGVCGGEGCPYCGCYVQHESVLKETQTEIGALLEQLAASQAREQQLRKVLLKLACLGNGDQYGNSLGNCIAADALALPQDDTAMKAWGAKLLDEIADEVTKSGYMASPETLRCKANELRNGEKNGTRH